MQIIIDHGGCGKGCGCLVSVAIFAAIGIITWTFLSSLPWWAWAIIIAFVIFVLPVVLLDEHHIAGKDETKTEETQESQPTQIPADRKEREVKSLLHYAPLSWEGEQADKAKRKGRQ